jgi:hypothetical protein
MLITRNNCEKPTPKTTPYRGYYSAIEKSLLITIPAGIIDFSWVPANCDSGYHLDGCYYQGCFTACEDVVYANGRPVECAIERQILLSPGSSGWLAFRALLPFEPDIQHIEINIEPVNKNVCLS